MPGTGLTIWSIGHSTRSPEEFLELLGTQRIELVADVRTLPRSRRYPHFSREALAPTLERTGIGYVHTPEVGGLRRARPDSRNTAWKNDAFRGYADYMETPEFNAGLEHLIASARKKRIVMMCAEADWRTCHRGLLSDALKARGIRVVHIGKGEPVEHPYTHAAKVIGQSVTYAVDGLWGDKKKE